MICSWSTAHIRRLRPDLFDFTDSQCHDSISLTTGLLRQLISSCGGAAQRLGPHQARCAAAAAALSRWQGWVAAQPRLRAWGGVPGSPTASSSPRPRPTVTFVTVANGQVIRPIEQPLTHPAMTKAATTAPSKKQMKKVGPGQGRKEVHVGTKAWLQANRGKAGAAQQRLLRVDAKKPKRAQALVAAKRTSREYGCFFQDDLRAAVKARLKRYRNPNARPSFDKLAGRFGVNASAIQDRCNRSRAKGRWAADRPEGKRPKGWTGKLIPFDDDCLFETGKQGADAVVPSVVEEAIAGFFALCCSSEVLMPANIDEGSTHLLGLMDENDFPYPESWSAQGGPPDHWWQRFFQQYPSLSQGYARMTDTMRVRFVTPPPS
jgi:hypothetical protein